MLGLRRLICYLLSAVLAALLSACSVAPFSNGYSAKTVGKNNWNLHGGFAEVPFLRAGYGVSDNSELGVVAESQVFLDVFGVYFKHAWLNPPEGFAFSMETSVGAGTDSTYAYFGPHVGYQLRWYEINFSPRFNYVHQGSQINVENSWLALDDMLFKRDLYYLGATLSQTAWVNKHVGLNVSANHLWGDLSGNYWGIGLIVKF